MSPMFKFTYAPESPLTVTFVNCVLLPGSVSCTSLAYNMQPGIRSEMQIFLIMSLSDCVFGDGAPLPGERPSLACPKTVYSFCNAHSRSTRQNPLIFKAFGMLSCLERVLRALQAYSKKTRKKVRNFKAFGAFLLDYALQML